MALNIQVQPRGDQYLFQGISQAGQGIGAGIEKMTANLKKAKAYRTMAIDALNMDPEEVDRMGLPELEGHFQAVALKSSMASAQAMQQEHQARMQELLAQAEERRHKMGLASDEAEAWPQLMQSIMDGRQGGGMPAAAVPGPADNPGEDGSVPPEMMPAGASSPMGPGQPGAPGPGPEMMMGGAAPTMGTQSTQFSPQEIMAGMARMGKTSPKLSAALSRVLLPRMLEGATSTGPVPWKSPEGNPYVWMGHTLMPDRPGLDPGSMMDVPGFTPVSTGPNKVQYLKTEKTVPAEFHSLMDKVGEDIASAQATLGQPDTAFVDATGKAQSPEYIKQMKGYAQKRLQVAQGRGKAAVDRYHGTGYLTPEQRDEMYQELGLEAAPAKKAAADAAAGGKPLTKEQAQQFLSDAKGDKDKARELAKKAGFTF